MSHSPRAIQKRTRQRPAFSCTECRRRKVRCDRAKPFCGQCRALDLVAACKYEGSHPTPVRRGAPNPPHNVQIPVDVSPSGRMRGVVSKTRVYGHGHWMNTFSLSDHQSAQHEITETVAQCKRLSRTIKKQRPSRNSVPADIQNYLADRKVLDELVELYFTTFESCYGILHYPTFLLEYEECMSHPEGAESALILQMLLIMVIAGPLHADTDIRREMAAKAQSCVHMAQTWLSAPLEKDRFTLSGIQLYCLLLLARQVNQVGADLIWTSAGSLMRMAMQMGFHQDPDLLGEISMPQKETRRRLWYTILEMNVQAALDSGMSPMITTADYNTKPPANSSDSGQAIGGRARVSFQRLLANSLPLRLRVARVVNDMQEEAAYDQVLELGKELAFACQHAAVAINQATTIGTFSSSFCSHLLGRFTLCLHYRYAVKAKTNPLYTHSRQVCVEAAIDLVSLLDDELYGRILCVGGGMFRDIFTRGALLIFVELSPDSENEISVFAIQRHRVRQEPLLRHARRVVQYAKDRIWCGDTNIKICVWFSMMMAQVEARLEGSNVDEAISSAMHESLAMCHGILKEMAARVPDDAVNNPDLGFWTPGNITPPNPDITLGSGFDGLNDEFFDFSFETWL
ncbi:putative C6 transcription factor [Aspergillus lucknowensis]|uniref:Fungal-specific transcription factor domain-containing protein n=1 Tax=Aspergillus lucknowensis TaxID=176173 RepID=A0ABR4LCW5_9EURO